MSTDAAQGSNETEQQSEAKKQPQTYNQIAAAHIDRLNGVNRQLPKVLTYFATALTQLTNNPIRSGDEGEEDSKAARLAAFRKYAIYVGYAISQIRDELKDQINDLEQCKVIPKSQPKFTTEAPRAESRGQDQDGKAVDPEAYVTNGGYGNFDVGVLNARASSGRVEGEDVLDRMKAILEELTKRAGETPAEERMVVDD